MISTIYKSPIGMITLIAEGDHLVGLYPDKHRAYRKAEVNNDHKVFKKTIKWLDKYFSGKDPKTNVPIKLRGTDFRKKIWKILLEIPYGKTVTYDEIAKQIEGLGEGRMSRRAVGGAVAHNPISIIVPCHRVLGVGNKLVGYSGGLEVKKKLLTLEGSDYV